MLTCQSGEVNLGGNCCRIDFGECERRETHCDRGSAFRNSNSDRPTIREVRILALS